MQYDSVCIELRKKQENETLLLRETRVDGDSRKTAEAHSTVFLHPRSCSGS